MKLRIRDYVITKDDLIFSVMSYDNTNGVKSLLRYIPDENGDRVRSGIRYRKLSFEEAYEFLEREYSEYVQDVHVVPERDIKEILRPEEALSHVRGDAKISKLLDCLKRIPLKKMGVTGSYLCGTQIPSSDIDFVIYGSYFDKARKETEKAKKSGKLSEVGDDEWRRIYEKRRPSITFEEFLAHETRKGNRGVIGETYFDLLYVRDWGDIKNFADWRGDFVAESEIIAKVSGVEFPFDVPTVYEVEHSSVSAVMNYTHTYIAQALPGETIEARGRIERKGNDVRLVVGTSREAKGEWIKSLSLLNADKP
jgi:hypothetical protein